MQNAMRIDFTCLSSFISSVTNYPGRKFTAFPLYILHSTSTTKASPQKSQPPRLTKLILHLLSPPLIHRSLSPPSTALTPPRHTTRLIIHPFLQSNQHLYNLLNNYRSLVGLSIYLPRQKSFATSWHTRSLALETKCRRTATRCIIEFLPPTTSSSAARGERCQNATGGSSRERSITPEIEREET